MSVIVANNIHGKMITIIAVGELRQVSRMDRDELYEIRDECSIYGDDYYFDKETGEYESACEDCWVTKAREEE